MRSPKILIKNNNGISIVMCCASCKNKQLLKDVRLCMLDNKKVTSDYLCPDWELHPSFEKAGIGGGRIKKRQYLEYALMNMGVKNDKRMDEYREKHGDIYDD